MDSGGYSILDDDMPPLLAVASLVPDEHLAIAIAPVAVGACRRFRAAAAAAAVADPALGTGRRLALRLSVHPTAITCANFKLGHERLHLAAALFGICPLFLIDGRIDDAHAPAWLAPALALVEAVSQAAAILSRGGVLTAIDDDLVITLPASVAIDHLSRFAASGDAAADLLLMSYGRAELARAWAACAAAWSNSQQPVHLDLDGATCQAAINALVASMRSDPDAGLSDPRIQAMVALRTAWQRARRESAH